jgi:uncharacterized Zn finger protein (UPF0148 family)
MTKRCPICGGNKFSVIDKDTMLCNYCGFTINKNEIKETKRSNNGSLDNISINIPEQIIFNNTDEKVAFLLDKNDFHLASATIRLAIEDTLKNKVKIKTITKDIIKDVYSLENGQRVSPSIDEGAYIMFYNEYNTYYKDLFGYVPKSRNKADFVYKNEKFFLSNVTLRFLEAIHILSRKIDLKKANKIKSDIWDILNKFIHWDSIDNKEYLDKKFPTNKDKKAFLEQKYSELKNIHLIQ